jgi:hypothetical protein
MCASIAEFQARSSDQIPQRARDENLSRARQRHHPARDMHRDSAELPFRRLSLPGVQTRTDRDTQTRNSCGDRFRRSHRSGRLIKCCEEPISCRIKLATTKPAQLAPNRLVVGRN